MSTPEVRLPRRLLLSLKSHVIYRRESRTSIQLDQCALIYIIDEVVGSDLL